MGLFPQFPYSNLHELNLDWIIEQIRQVTGDGFVLSVNGLSGVVTLYTENNIALPDCHYDTEWSVARLIDEKIAGIKFTGEKFFYITKNHDAEEFTVQEVYTSGNPPPYPVTSVNSHDGAVVLAGDNLPYVIDGPYTIEDIVEAIEHAIGAVILGKKCNQAVTAGQYVFLIMSNITDRADGLYKAVNNVSANTNWTSADLQAVSGGLGAELANAENDIVTLNSKIAKKPLTIIPAANITMPWKYASEIAGIVQMMVFLQGISLNGWDTLVIGSINTTFTESVYIPVMVVGGDGNVRAEITTNGTIILRNWSADQISNAEMHFNAITMK